jgi:hypothetical protein
MDRWKGTALAVPQMAPTLTASAAEGIVKFLKYLTRKTSEQ